MEVLRQKKWEGGITNVGLTAVDRGEGGDVEGTKVWRGRGETRRRARGVMKDRGG